MSERIIKVPELFTDEEVATALGLTNKNSVGRLRRSGRIGYTKVSQRVIRYSQKHIDDYLKSVESCPNIDLPSEEPKTVTETLKPKNGTLRGVKTDGISGYQLGLRIAERHSSSSRGF